VNVQSFDCNMRERGSVLYLEMTKELLNLPQICINGILLSANWQQKQLHTDFEQGLSTSLWMEVESAQESTGSE